MKTYSLWLVPEESALSKFLKIIGDLSEKYNSPKFEPHITLLSRIEGEEDDLIKKTEELVSFLSTLTITLESFGFSKYPHKALYLNVKKTDELLSAHEKASEIYSHNAEFAPHMSLLWGTFDIDLKLKIIEELGEQNDTFKISSVELYDITNEDENLWKCIEKINIKN